MHFNAKKLNASVLLILERHSEILSPELDSASYPQRAAKSSSHRA